MAQTVAEYWREVHRAAEVLPEVVLLVSLSNGDIGTTAGAVCECSRKQAAECIVRKTHRVATQAEAKAWESEHEQRKKQISEAEYKRKQNFALPDEINDLMAAAVRGVMAGKAKGDEKK